MNRGAWLLAAFLCACLCGQEPAPTWTLRGRVVAEETGEPLAGCTVTITGHQATGYPLHWSWMDWENAAPLTTGADGRFELAFPAQPGRGIGDGYPSRVHVVVNADARVQQFGHVFLSRFFASPVQDVGDIRVVAGCSPDVIVVDAAGKPQEDVVVRLRHDDALVLAEQPPSRPRPWCWPRLFVEFRSDAAGRLVLDTPLAFGRHRIDVRNRKLTGDAVLDVTRDGTGPLRITVEAAPGLVANGRVVDDQGKPVAGLALVASCGEGSQETYARASTRSDGTYQLVTVAPPAPTFRLRVARNTILLPLDLGSGKWGEDAGAVEVPSCVSVKVRPRLPAGCDAKRLAVHLCRAATNDPHANAMRVVVACVDGIATIDGVPRGEYSLRIHAIGTGLWPSEWVACSARGGGAPIDVALAPLVEQPVLVFTADGRPCDGVQLEVVLAAGDTLRKARQEPIWLPCHPYAMTGDAPTEQSPGPTAAPVRTDRSGRATLRAIAWNSPAAVRVTGPFVVPTIVDLEAFAGDTKPVEIRVPGAGAVVLELGDPALRVARDAAAPEDRARAAEWGPGFDPWGRSLGHLLQQTATGLLLRPTAAGGTEHFVPCADVAQLRVDSVAPGAYEVCLLVRERKDKEILAHIIEPALLQVRVEAGEVTTAVAKLQDVHRARLR